MTPPNALIFDFGNVIAHFDYARACSHYGRRLGLSGGEFLGRLRERGLTPLVQRYESGRMTAEEFSREVCALAGLEIPYEQFAAAWSDIFWLNEPIVPLVRHLKGRGYRLVLGSNTNDLHAAQFRRQFAEALAPFDWLVLSYEIGHIKPSVPFYLACAEAARAKPEDCIFIDDLAENVEGARSAGLKGLLFRDVSKLIDDLGALGIEVPEPLPSDRLSGRSDLG